MYFQQIGLLMARFLWINEQFSYIKPTVLHVFHRKYLILFHTSVGIVFELYKLKFFLQQSVETLEVFVQQKYFSAIFWNSYSWSTIVQAFRKLQKVYEVPANTDEHVQFAFLNVLLSTQKQSSKRCFAKLFWDIF